MPERSRLIIAGGTVIDATGERRADVIVGPDGTIAAVAGELAAEATGSDRTLDARGCIVAPGLVDLHAHLRQPGGEQAETVESGSRAAVLGGFCAVVAMPNTNPSIDSAALVREVQELGRAALCQVEVAGAITVDRAGDRLAPMGEMAALGVRLFTDDGAGVQDTAVMRRALEYASDLGVRLAQHCEVDSLAAGGHMHEGEWSSRLGIPGIPAEAEEIMVMRDVALSRLTGAPVHFQHLSTARLGRHRGGGATQRRGRSPPRWRRTTSRSPDEACASYDARFKVNPPLRPADDVAAVRAALARGNLDAIATDHAPHTADAKDRPFEEAPPGMLGLETALALALTELDLSPAEVLALLSWQPARIAGIDDAHGGPIEVGRPANLCVFDTSAPWTPDEGGGASRSRNTPYVGRQLRGRVRHTLVAGEAVVVDGEAQR